MSSTSQPLSPRVVHTTDVFAAIAVVVVNEPTYAPIRLAYSGSIVANDVVDEIVVGIILILQ